jgi:hypothetical protein
MVDASLFTDPLSEPDYRKTSEKTEEAIKNSQSRDTGNI